MSESPRSHVMPMKAADNDDDSGGLQEIEESANLINSVNSGHEIKQLKRVVS